MVLLAPTPAEIFSVSGTKAESLTLEKPRLAVRLHFGAVLDSSGSLVNDLVA